MAQNRASVKEVWEQGWQYHMCKVEEVWERGWQYHMRKVEEVWEQGWQYHMCKVEEEVWERGWQYHFSIMPILELTQNKQLLFYRVTDVPYLPKMS